VESLIVEGLITLAGALDAELLEVNGHVQSLLVGIEERVASIEGLERSTISLQPLLMTTKHIWSNIFGCETATALKDLFNDKGP
jgi:hypothetical protein